MTRFSCLVHCCAVVLIACGSKPTETRPVEDPPVEKPLRCNLTEPANCDIEGMKFENAVGRSLSRNEAARHYAAACDAGLGSGCTHLAGLYFENDDTEQATALYDKACQAGDAEGCANLGFMKSRAGDVPGALSLYQKACDAGSMAACANLADMHQAGRTGAVDHDAANRLLERSCSGGHPSACIRRAWAAAQGCEKAACKNQVSTEKEAAELTAAACDAKKQPLVCTGYAVHLESGKLVPRDEEKARKLYGKACDDGEPWGCERLGTALMRGLGGEKDVPAALSAFEKACDASFAPACSALGAALLGAEGIDRDTDRGAQLVRKACELHEARACNTLQLLGL